MIRSRLYILLISVFSYWCWYADPAAGGTATAITAEEMLADPLLETRARNLSQKLRCLVCQNQSIDDSDADLAKICGARNTHSLSEAKLMRLFYLIYVPNMVTLFFWLRHWQKNPGFVAGPDFALLLALA